MIVFSIIFGGIFYKKQPSLAQLSHNVDIGGVFDMRGDLTFCLLYTSPSPRDP